jgi:hypothetical protein
MPGSLINRSCAKSSVKGNPSDIHKLRFRKCDFLDPRGLLTNKMPSRSEPSGRVFVSQPALSAAIALLLVVDRGAFDFLALRIGSTGGDRAGLAIR